MEPKMYSSDEFSSEGIMIHRKLGEEPIVTKMERGKRYYSADPVKQTEIESQIKRNEIFQYFHPFRVSHKLAVTFSAGSAAFEMIILLFIGSLLGYILRYFEVKYYYLIFGIIVLLWFDPKPYGRGGELVDDVRNFCLIIGLWCGFALKSFLL